MGKICRLLRRTTGGVVGETLNVEFLRALPGLHMDTAFGFCNWMSNPDGTGNRSAFSEEHSGRPTDKSTGVDARFGVVIPVVEESSCMFGAVLKLKPLCSRLDSTLI